MAVVFLLVPVWSAPQDFALQVDAVQTAPRQLKISAPTDLPDGAIVTLSVERLYDETITDKYLPKRVQTASGEIYKKDHVVTKGRVEATVNVDDSVWVQKRDALAKKMSAAEMIFSPVRNVRPVCGGEGALHTAEQRPAEARHRRYRPAGRTYSERQGRGAEGAVRYEACPGAVQAEVASAAGLRDGLPVDQHLAVRTDDLHTLEAMIPGPVVHVP